MLFVNFFVSIILWEDNRESNSNTCIHSAVRSPLRHYPQIGAGDENRTRVSCLEGRANAIIEHPHGGLEGIRTPSVSLAKRAFSH
jgi:hypothetical protein